MSDGLTLFADLVVHLLLTGLPLVAAMLFAARFGVGKVPLLLAVGLAASGLSAILAFWAFYLDPVLGKTFSYFVGFGAALLSGWCLYEGRIERTLLRRLATPLALWALGSIFLVFFGFVHGGSDSALATSSTRFSGQLPTDNDIPRFFSDWFFAHGHHGTPPIYPGEWLASDRPPLQVGYALLQRTFAWDDTGLHYQVMGVVLQQLWILGLWALLTAGGAGRVTRAMAMLTVLLSDLAIVNGFFVWPKMLPAAMLLAAAALVLTPLWPGVRKSLWGAALFAALLGLAMLGHGSSLFGAIPLIAIAALRALPSWRWVGVGLGVGAVLLGSWSAYQKYGDPPGNRLTKWYLGGAIEIDKRGVVEAIADGYGEAGLGGSIDNKVDNFETMSGGEPAAVGVENIVRQVGDDDLTDAVAEARNIFFLYLLPSLGLLLVGPVAMVVGWRRRNLNPDEWRLASICLAAFAIGAISWGLILFGGSLASTVIHQGSYLIPVLGLCGAAVGLRAVFPRFALWLLAANALLMLAIYAPSLEPPAGSGYSPFAAAVAVLALAGFGAAASRAA
jgi:hypothetical protein